MKASNEVDESGNQVKQLYWLCDAILQPRAVRAGIHLHVRSFKIVLVVAESTCIRPMLAKKCNRSRLEPQLLHTSSAENLTKTGCGTVKHDEKSTA